MREQGIDISCNTHRLLTREMVDRTSRVITMDSSLDEACPATTVPTTGWSLADPADRPIAEVSEIGDLIERKVRELLAEI
jgi:protein-tyrosine-phosphatase